MKNNAFTKGLAGLGTGMAQAGLMGYKSQLDEKLEAKRAVLQSKRDEVLNRYATDLQSSALTSSEKLATERNSTEIASILSRSETAILDRENAVDISEAKIASDKEIAKGNRGKAIRMSDAVVYESGKFKVQKESHGGSPSEREKFALQEKARLNAVLNSEHPGLYEKLTSDERERFQHMYLQASKLIDGGTNHNTAYEQVLAKWVRAKKTEAIGGPGVKSKSAITNAKSLFGY